MTVTIQGAVQVDLIDLRQAFESVRAHAGPSQRGDQVNALHRVRLVLDATHVNVMAASGATMALAQVTIEQDTRPNPEDADDGAFVVDLRPDFVQDFLQVYPARKPRKDADAQEGRVEITFAPDHVMFEDRPGGLIPGRTLGTDMADPSTQFPDVAAHLGRAMRNADAVEVRKPLVTGGGVLKLWEAAGRHYKAPVRISPSGPVESPTYVVEVGHSFIGSFGSRPGDDHTQAEHRSNRRRWLEVLPNREIADGAYNSLLGMLPVADDQDDDD